MFSALVVALPQLPTKYEGFLTDSDGNPVSGEQITVLDSYEFTVSVSSATSADGIYTLNVVWDDPDTATREGVTSGERIYFKLGAQELANTIVGNKGDNIRLDLTYQTSDPSNGNADDIILPEPELYQNDSEENISIQDEINDLESVVTNLTSNMSSNQNTSPNVSQGRENQEDEEEKSGNGINGTLIGVIIVVVIIIVLIIILKKRKK